MKIARKRSRKLNPLDPGRGDGSQQTRKERRAFEVLQPRFCFRPVAVHVLADQMNLAIAVIAKLLYLGDDVGRRPTLLPAARKRNDAVSAELVAALNDRNKRDIWRGPRARRQVPRLCLPALVQIDDAALALEGPINQSRQTIRGARAHNQTHRRRVIEKRLPFELRNATHNSNDRFAAESHAPDFTNARKYLVGSTLTNGTCVENHDVRLLRPIRQFVAGIAQAHDCTLAISDIHLTSKRFDVNARAHSSSGDCGLSLTDLAKFFLSMTLQSRFALCLCESSVPRW